MSRLGFVLTVLIFLAFGVIGCDGGSTEPCTAFPGPELSDASGPEPQADTYCWGCYLVGIDPDTGTVNVIPARTLGFTVNVVQFLNTAPNLLMFQRNAIKNGPG